MNAGSGAGSNNGNSNSGSANGLLDGNLNLAKDAGSGNGNNNAGALNGVGDGNSTLVVEASVKTTATTTRVPVTAASSETATFRSVTTLLDRTMATVARAPVKEQVMAMPT